MTSGYTFVNKLEEILIQALSRGLNEVCITDYNTMAAGQVISEGMQANPLCVLIGRATGGAAIAAHPCYLRTAGICSSFGSKG